MIHCCPLLRCTSSLLLGATLLFACSTGSEKSSTETADAIYFNGSIITMEGDDPAYVEALAVKDGKILFVGTRAEAMRMKGERTAMNDLQGRALLPGFIDSHSHYINALSNAGQAKLYAPPAGPGKDVPSIIAELQRFAEERNVPKGAFIIGYGYDDTVMPDGHRLNRDDLDAAFPDNPVRVDHVSMHGTVLNSLALKHYGYDANTKTPEGGVIVRKPGTNEPWGLIMETAYQPVHEDVPEMTPEEEIESTRAAHRMYASFGITTAQEGLTHMAQLQAMLRAGAAGAHSIDVVCHPFVTEVEKVLPVYPLDTWGSYTDRVKIGGVKITIDGSPQGRTAAFTTPYLTGGPGGEKNWKGQLFVGQDMINEGLKKVYDLNVPVTFHVNGDAAIDALITAHEFAAANDLTKYRNVTAIHAQFLRKDQIELFAKYKIRPSLYTLHTYYFADAHIANRGQEQAMYISPMRDAIDAGLHPTNHTDAIVAPLDQLFMLWSAVNRISRSGIEVGPDQRITPYEGLKTMTIWAAEQYDEQASKGTLAPGKLADLVILDNDPLKVDPMAIKEIQVVETIKEGQQIFKL